MGFAPAPIISCSVRHHSREHLYAVACAAMFVFGLILGLPGTVLGLPEVVGRFGLSLADRGTLIAMLFVGLLIGSLGSGPVVDRLGQRASIVVSAVLVATAFPLFATASRFLVASTALAALGIAGAGFNTSSNALASDLFPEERGRRMNGIAVAVGLGGLAMPVMAALTEGRASWQTMVFAASVLALLVALAAGALRLPDARPPLRGRGGVRAFRYFVGRPGFMWFCLLLALGGANEASTAGWTSTYLVASGFSPTAAAWGLSSLWFGEIAGRLLFAGRVDRAKRAAIVRGGLAGAAGVAVLVVVRVPAVLAVAPFAIGVAIAVVMPTSLALASERYPGSTGTLIGTLLTLSQVGGIAVPALVGVVAQLAGLRAGMALLIVSCALAALVAWRAGAPRQRAEVA
jgi:fucose permease